MEKWEQNLIQHNFQKAIGIEIGYAIPMESIEKARSGVYENNEENRILGRVGQKYGENKQEQLDFLDSLREDYIIDFDKKNKSIYVSFYKNLPKEFQNKSFVLQALGDLSNNLPESIVTALSKVKIYTVGSFFYKVENAYWAAAYDPNKNEIHFNRDLYSSTPNEPYFQYEYTRTLLHEFSHKIHTDYVSDSVVSKLWDTKERVSEQASESMEENIAESLAYYFMNMGSEGDTVYNSCLQDFKEEYPKTYIILKTIIKDLHEKR